MPLAFVHGVVGQFFQSLSIALSIALLVSMVVSLTIIPVLASRFLVRRPMPCDGPIYNFLADGYEAVLRSALRISALSLCSWLWRWLFPAGCSFVGLDSGFMPDMDEGAFILDYEMPVGTSLAQTDKILRRVEAVLQESPDISGYIRRTGAENGLFVTESFRGDILVSLKPPGQRRPMKVIFDSLEEDIKKAVPELESLELIAPHSRSTERLGGLAATDRNQSLWSRCRSNCERWQKKLPPKPMPLKLDEVNAHVHLGNPDLGGSPEQCPSHRGWD